MRVPNFEFWKLNFEQIKFWTLIHLINNFVIVILYLKCSELITLEENVTSFQQLTLFFVSSSEVLNSELFFKKEFLKNVLVYIIGVFSFSVSVTVFMRFPKIILVSGFSLLICISYSLKFFYDLTLKSSIIHVQCPC